MTSVAFTPASDLGQPAPSCVQMSGLVDDSLSKQLPSWPGAAPRCSPWSARAEKAADAGLPGSL